MSITTGIELDTTHMQRFFRHVTPVSVIDSITGVELAPGQIKLFVGVDAYWSIEPDGGDITITAPDGRSGNGDTIAQALANLS